MQHRPHFPGVWALAGLILLSGSLVPAAAPVPRPERGINKEPIKESNWRSASKNPLTSAEIDEMIVGALKNAGITPAPIVNDELFLRRIHLDLTGKPPSLPETRAFLVDTDPQKRAKLIDKLLESDAFTRHWATYWHDVMSARLVNNFQGRALARPFERWMGEQIKKNRSWGEVTRDILTASGTARFDDTEGKGGPMYFLASHMGADAVAEQTAETARVFLGIQINCAQCHNHPFDVWKREQFHELAAYFARVRSRLVRDPNAEKGQVRFIGVELASDGGFGRGFGGGGFGRMGGGMEYRMPDKNDPRRGTIVHPKSLTGDAPKHGLKDADRRKSLVDSIVAPDNYWFSAAYVNRVWGVLVGQGFYQPVDDLGPQREAVHGAALARMVAGFTASNYDMKAFFRVVLNTQTYQRQSRTGENQAEHLLFAAAYPTRLRPTALWASLDSAIGPFQGGFGGRGGMMMAPSGRFGFRGGLEGTIRNEFAFDPSLKNEDIEGSIPQALTLMNNQQLNNRTRAQGTTMLAGVLKAHSADEAALEEVYLRVLTRKPTEAELKKCVAFIKKVEDRSEAYEDILWALLNSTEFLTRR
jgi:Protein of unknown function (DUF1549)/Protein of unknown function (DUF1553)